MTVDGWSKLVNQISNTSGVQGEIVEKVKFCQMGEGKGKERKIHRKQLTPMPKEGEVVGSSLVKGFLSAKLDSTGKQEIPFSSGQNGVSSVYKPIGVQQLGQMSVLLLRIHLTCLHFRSRNSSF